MTETGLAYSRICSLDDVWEGEMQTFTVDGTEVLVVHADGGTVNVFSPICPHQDYPLIEGELDGATLTCTMHRWVFNARTGESINPSGCQLKTYPSKVEDDQVFADLGG